MTVLVIRSTEMERTREFFEKLGLTFVSEKHGSGPQHWTCEVNGAVFEIYPSNKTDSVKFLN